MIARERSKGKLHRGQRVYQKDRSGFRFGSIIEPGDEQSGVRWDGSKDILYEINRYMESLIEDQHLWIRRFGFWCCFRCGAIRRKDDDSKCKLEEGKFDA